MLSTAWCGAVAPEKQHKTEEAHGGAEKEAQGSESSLRRGAEKRGAGKSSLTAKPARMEGVARNLQGVRRRLNRRPFDFLRASGTSFNEGLLNVNGVDAMGSSERDIPLE